MKLKAALKGVGHYIACGRLVGLRREWEREKERGKKAWYRQRPTQKRIWNAEVINH